MSDTQAPVAATAAPVKKDAIQLIEEQLANFAKQREQQVANVTAIEKQREQAIANVHAVEGAMQGAQHLIALLKAEALKAEAEAAKLAEAGLVEVDKVVEFVKKEL
jgi:hypothetical protein